jgi:nucleotide-binding universal stress UspA family protein
MPKILIDENYGIQQSVDRLLGHAAKRKASLIGRHYKRAFKSRTILLPTDFETSSEVAFGKVCKHALETDSKLVILHVFSPSFRGLQRFNPVLVPSAGLIYSKLGEEEERRRELTAEFSKRAKANGLRCKAIFETSKPTPSTAIVKTARAEGASYIAMAPRTKSLSALFPGSVTRQVVRTSPCPVWVLSVKPR